MQPFLTRNPRQRIHQTVDTTSNHACWWSEKLWSQGDTKPSIYHSPCSRAQWISFSIAVHSLEPSQIGNKASYHTKSHSIASNSTQQGSLTMTPDDHRAQFIAPESPTSNPARQRTTASNLIMKHTQRSCPTWGHSLWACMSSKHSNPWLFQ